MWNLSSANLKSALIYALLMGVVSIGIYIVGVGDIFKIDPHALINSGILAAVTGLISLLKNLLTDNAGKFLGMTTVIPDKVDPKKSPLNDTTIAN